MKLKLDFATIKISGFLLVLILSSCGARTPKAEDAFDIVKKERMLSDDSSFVSKEIIQASMKTEPVKKIEAPDDWTKFKIEIEKKIRLNEIQIKKIKELPSMNGSMRRKLAVLEKDNNNLKIRLESYNEEVKSRWEMFKASMSHNANEIGIELSALKTDK